MLLLRLVFMSKTDINSIAIAYVLGNLLVSIVKDIFLDKVIIVLNVLLKYCNYSHPYREKIKKSS